MKFLLLIFALILCASAFAIDPQEGNGAHICKASDGTYRTVDELNFQRFPERELKYRASPLVERFSSTLDRNIRLTDLTRTSAGRNVEAKFKKIYERDEVLGRELLQYFKILDHVFITKQRLFVNDNGTNSSNKCRPHTLEAAIHSDNIGLVIVSETAWERLPLSTQEILLIHETLRAAQLYSNWFHTVSYEELQRVAILLNLNKAFAVKNEKFHFTLLTQNDRLLGMQPTDLHQKALALEYYINRALQVESYSKAYKANAELALLDTFIDHRHERNNFHYFSRRNHELRQYTPYYKRLINDYKEKIKKYYR